MRLWSLHPKYLDAKGIVALWREALLAQKVLEGTTKGYTQHPQLIRFKKLPDPVSGIRWYLAAVFEESRVRKYTFDQAKIGAIRTRPTLAVTDGQLKYEWTHLQGKLWKRDRTRHLILMEIDDPEPHPMFCKQSGGIAEWEVV